jgi:hypothetical protein
MADRSATTQDAGSLEIVVAVSPSQASLEGDIRLIKPALLYGDRVILYSPAATLIGSVAALGAAEGEERIQAMLAIMKVMGRPIDEEMEGMLRGVQAFGQMSRAARRKLGGAHAKELQEMARQLEVIWEPMREKAEEVVADAGGNDLVRPIELGLLRMDPLLEEGDEDLEAVLARFTQKLGETLGDAHSYPLFDDATGNLVRAGLADGLFVARPTWEASVSGVAAPLICPGVSGRDRGRDPGH